MTNDQKAMHLAFLRTSFVPAVKFPVFRFTADDLVVLLKFGSWYQALENGQIEPITERQKVFLERIAKERALTGHESVWLKYRKVLHEAGKTLPRAEPLNGAENHNLVEIEYVDPLAID